MKGLSNVVLIVVLTNIVSVAAFECYECSDCTVPFSSYFADTAECDNASCMKINITYRRTVIVSRGCSTTYYGLDPERCELREVSGTVSETCYCNDDECNGSDDMKPTLTLRFSHAIVVMMCILKCFNL